MATPTYDLLDSTTLSASASSVTFTSIDQSYRDLVLVVDFINDTATNAQAYCRFNGDTNQNYNWVYALGFGSGTQSQAPVNERYINLGQGIAVNDGEAQLITASIQDYSATDKHKTILSRGNSEGGTIMLAGRWANTSAITSLEVYTTNGEFSSGVFSLYGIAS